MDCGDSDTDIVSLIAIADADGNIVQFWYLDETVKKNIKFVDYRTIKAEGIGKVDIKRSNGKKTVIRDVLYVPGMKSNLLSFGQMLEKGYSVVMKDGYLELLNTKNKVVLKTLLSKNIITFKVEGDSLEYKCMNANVNEESWM